MRIIIDTNNNRMMQLSRSVSARRVSRFFAASPLFIVCIMCFVGIIPIVLDGYPSGAPEMACKSLKPGHGVEPSSAAPPYELKQDKKEVDAGDQIKVTLTSDSKTPFKGLIVQAVNEKGEPVGKFLSGKGLKTLDSCSAVTHSDNEAKKTATLVWEAPSDISPKTGVSFKATVVQKFDEIFMNIKSTL